MKNAYEVQAPDFNLSPYTGMTKKHYIECAKYLLERAFKYVDSIETPLSFPPVPGKTYPSPTILPGAGDPSSSKLWSGHSRWQVH